MDEIQRPAGIGFRLDQDRCTRADSTPPGLSLANGKPFLAIKTVYAIDAGRLSISPKQDEQPTVASKRCPTPTVGLDAGLLGRQLSAKRRHELGESVNVIYLR